MPKTLRNHFLDDKISCDYVSSSVTQYEMQTLNVQIA